jgi:hypothetical protein
MKTWVEMATAGISYVRKALEQSLRLEIKIVNLRKDQLLILS